MSSDRNDPSADIPGGVAGPPLRILWYWPHPFRDTHPVASALTELGHEVVVQCLSTFDGEHIERPPAPYRLVEDLPDVKRGGRGWRRAARTLRTQVQRAWLRHRLARRLTPDLVFIELSNPPVDAFALPVLSHRAAPVLLQVHDVVAHQGSVPAAADRWLRARTYRSARRLVTLHRDVADELVRRFPVTAGKVDVVEPVLSPSDVPLPLAEGRTRPRYLLFGSLRPNKGISNLLAALRQIVDPPFDVTMAGPAEAAMAAELTAAQAEVPSLDVRLGFASAEDRIALYAACDVVLLPYSATYRSSSGVLRDAQQFGRAVIASDVGSVGLEVRRWGAGWLVPPDDPERLARTLVEVAGAPEDVRARAMSARKACEVHTADATALLLDGIYRDVASGAADTGALGSF